jgi:hypothetical protein
MLLNKVSTPFLKPLYVIIDRILCIGLTFLGLLVGALIGESLSGRLSDYIVAKKVKNNGGIFVPEMRLTMLPVALVLIPIGLFLWGALVSVPTHWIGPVVAGGMHSSSIYIPPSL